MSSLLLTASRKYPAVPTVGGDVVSHTKAIEALRDAVQIHERRSNDVLSSFVRIKDLIDLGIVRLVSDNRIEFNASSGGASVLDDLDDVETVGAVDNDRLTYNATYGLWLPEAVAASSPLTTKGDLYGRSTVDDRIPVGANDTVLTADSSQTLGVKWATPAASIWTNVINQPFSSNTTGFSSNGSGTWAISGGELVQSVNNTNGPVFWCSTRVPYGAARLKCDVYFTSAGAGASQCIGFWMGPASPPGTPTNNATLWMRNDSGTKTVKAELFGGSVFVSTTQTFALDTYHALEFLIIGNRISMYLNGAAIGSDITTNSTFSGYERFGLFCYGGAGKFKNFTVDIVGP